MGKVRDDMGTRLHIDSPVNMQGNIIKSGSGSIDMGMTSLAIGWDYTGMGRCRRRVAMASPAACQVAGLSPQRRFVAAAGKRCTVAIGVGACTGSGVVAWNQSASLGQDAKGNRVGLNGSGTQTGSIEVINGTKPQAAVTFGTDICNIQSIM